MRNLTVKDAFKQSYHIANGLWAIVDCGLLRAIVLRLLRMQPKDDTLICNEAHEGPYGTR